MPFFIVTDFAGEYVAGRRSPGAGVRIQLSEEEADHDLRVGSLRRWGEPLAEHKERAEAASEPEPAKEPEPKQKPAEEPRKRGK